MLDRKVWDPLLERLRAVLIIQPPSKERDIILNTIIKLGYNFWHRSMLPQWCYATDIDFIEFQFNQNNIELKALIETKHANSIITNNKRDWQTEIYKTLAKQLNIPFYICTFENKFKTFKLEQVYPVQNIWKLNEQQYIEFQKRIHQIS